MSQVPKLPSFFVEPRRSLSGSYEVFEKDKILLNDTVFKFRLNNAFLEQILTECSAYSIKATDLAYQ